RIVAAPEAAMVRFEEERGYIEIELRPDCKNEAHCCRDGERDGKAGSVHDGTTSWLSLIPASVILPPSRHPNASRSCCWRTSPDIRREALGPRGSPTTHFTLARGG